MAFCTVKGFWLKYPDRDQLLRRATFTNTTAVPLAIIPGQSLRKALAMEPENMGYMVGLAYFLIDKARSTNEGLELVNKSLELNPDNYSFLYTKGWGLYKQGKYQEALGILQKSWNLRKEQAVYNHDAYLHLEAAKKAVANQKNN